MALAMMAGLAFLAWPRPAMAQTGGLWTFYTAESAEGGPPASSIRDVLPLENQVWVTTDAGIGYYDGHHWQTFGIYDYRPDIATPIPLTGPGAVVQKGPLPPERVHTVVRGHDGRLWFGAESGITIRNSDGSWEPFADDDALPGRSVTAILVAQDGTTWLGTHRGLARLGPEGTLAGVPSPGPAQSYILALAENPAGQIWVGTQADGLRRFDGESWQCYTGVAPATERTAGCTRVLPGEGTQINALASDGGAGLWVGTGTGLAHFDGRTFVPVPDALATRTAGQSILALGRDASDHLWIGLEGGVLILEGQTVRPPFGSQTLSLGEVRAIRGDLEGNVWLATDDGLLRYRRAWEPLSLDGASIPAGSGAIAQDQAGGLWFGMDGFVARLSPDGTWQRLDPMSRLPSLPAANVIRAILPYPGGEVGFGSDAGMVRLTTDGRWEVIDLPLTTPAGVKAMLLDGESNVWLGTTQGLGRLAPDGTWAPVTVNLPQQPVVYALLRDKGGQVWAGTSYGVIRVTPTGDVLTYTVSHGLADQTVYSLYRDSSGQLWVGTLGGVSRWVGEGGKMAFLDLGGLEGQEVRAMAEDRLGRLWFATRRGAFVYDGRSVIRYTISDGLASNDVRGLFQDRDGRLWLATATGIQHYAPGRAHPWVSIVGLRVGNQVFPPQGGRVALAWNQAEFTVVVDGGDLSTSLGELTVFYEMQGVDSGSGRGSQALMYRLPPGQSYVFTAETRDKDLNSSPTARLQIDIGAVPITERGWFRNLTLWLGLVGLPLAGLYIFGYPVYKRRGEYRYHLDVSVTLRQPGAQATSHVAEVAIRYLGLSGWRWRLAALRRGDVARAFDPAERLPAAPLSRPPGLDNQLHILEEEPGRYPGDAQMADETRLRPPGRALFQAAFPQTLAGRLKDARTGEQRVRIRLHFDEASAADLARLPWEFAYHDDLGFLAQHVETTLVRSLDAPQPPQGRLRDRLRILVVIANGSDLELPPVQTARERLLLTQGLQKMTERGKLELSYLVGPAAARLDPNLPPGSVASDDLGEALRQRLNQRPGFDVVHFIGHAGPHWQATEGLVEHGEMVLYAESAEGYYAPLGGQDLVKILDGLHGQGLVPRLFFLNACQTGDVAGTESLTGLIPALIVKGRLPAVIGMQYPIDNRIAAQFAGTFYQALIQHGQADWAMAIARNAVAQGVGDSQRDWGIPVLYLQAQDGFIFKTY
jgi:ligand-binding sensor domain-containing protein